MDEGYRVDLELEINTEAMQALQDSFCKANDMYIMCVSKTQGQVTSFSGTRPEEEFVDRYFSGELRREIVDSFVDGNVENVVGRYGTEDYLLYRGVAIRGLEGKCQGVWLCFGIAKEKLPDTTAMAIEIMTQPTNDHTQELFERNVFALLMISPSY